MKHDYCYIKLIPQQKLTVTQQDTNIPHLSQNTKTLYYVP